MFRSFTLLGLALTSFALPIFASASPPSDEFGTRSNDAGTAPNEVGIRGWTVWVSLGGYITSDPVACTVGNWTYVVARGGDGFMYFRRRYLPTGIWDDWKRVPGKAFSGAPGVRCETDGAGKPWIEVQAIGQDGKLWRNYNSSVDGASWGPWQNDTPFSANVGSGPALTQIYAPLFMRHILAKGQDLYLYDRYQTSNGTWSNWLNLGTPILYDPAATMQTGGHLDIAYVTHAGILMHRLWENGIWYTPTPVSGDQIVYSSPELISRSPGTMDLFVRGAGNVMLHKTWTNSGWPSSWENLGGAITSGPGAATYASNARMFVFARWSDGSLYYRAWAP